MKLNTTIEVERGDDMIEVEIEGTFENYGSQNPHERGLHLSDYEATGPDGKPFDLTKDEGELAEEKLYDELYNFTGG